jgi:nicotinamidase-related amidase
MRARKDTALLIVDMLNTLDFPEAKKLLPRALAAARRIARLRERCDRRRVPVIFVNDNFGHWEADWKKIFALAAREDSLGRPLAELLAPRDGDYFVLKPRHSGFYGTSLELLLDKLGKKHLLITGVAGNVCVLFTAHEAHMRGYEVTVPSDCIASNRRRDDTYAVRQLRETLGIKTTPSPGLRL